MSMTAMPIERVGVIGTGAMGSGVVQSLVRIGVATTARDISPEAQARAVALGASAASSAAHAARTCDVLILLVVDAAQVDTVLFGDRGVAGAMGDGGIVIVCSTVDPAYVSALAPRLARSGLALLDAPVSGGPAKAASGTMSMMLAGDKAARERVQSILRGITGALFTIGDRVGDAAIVKIVNNLMAGANLAIAAEALAVAKAAGLDLRLVADVIDASSGASWIVHDRLPRALADDYAPRAATRVLLKDVGIALDLAGRVNIATPLAAAARDAFADAVAAGHAEDDDAAMFLRAWQRAKA